MGNKGYFTLVTSHYSWFGVFLVLGIAQNGSETCKLDTPMSTLYTPEN